MLYANYISIKLVGGRSGNTEVGRDQKSVLKKKNKQLRPSEAGGPCPHFRKHWREPLPFLIAAIVFYQQRRDPDAAQWVVQLESVFLFQVNDNPKRPNTLAIGA